MEKKEANAEDRPKQMRRDAILAMASYMKEHHLDPNKDYSNHPEHGKVLNELYLKIRIAEHEIINNQRKLIKPEVHRRIKTMTDEEAQLTALRKYDYHEVVTLLSWPGKTMHVLFPRFWRLTDQGGAVLAEGSALWTLMDQNTRAMVFPDEHGVSIPGEVTGWETPLPRPPKMGEAEREERFTVPYSWVDLNGHMNNCRYLDLAEDVLPPELHEMTLRAVSIEYSGEAHLGEALRLRWGNDGGSWFLSGEGAKRLFRMRLEYDPVDN